MDSVLDVLDMQVACSPDAYLAMKGNCPGNLKVRRRQRQFKLARERRPKNPNMRAGARKSKPRVEVETIIKENAPTPMPEIVTEEPEFELHDIDTKILPPRP